MKDDSHVLIGTRIELDREKVEREGKYDYNALIKRLDYIAEHFGLEVLESGHLYGNKKDMMYHDSDLASTRMMFYLAKCRWFIETVKTWDMSFNYMSGSTKVWDSVLDAINKHHLKERVMYVE